MTGCIGESWQSEPAMAQSTVVMKLESRQMTDFSVLSFPLISRTVSPLCTRESSTPLVFLLAWVGTRRVETS